MINKILMGLCATLVSLNVLAGGEYIVVEGTVTSVANTGSNLENFVVRTTGGSGICTSSRFPLSSAPNKGVHDRAYAAALLALTTGMEVTIYNYEDNSCEKAVYLSIAK